VNYGDSRLPERFWSRVYPCPITGCWLWGGGRQGSMGYGAFWWEGRQSRTHRLVFQIGGGCLTTEEVQVLHSCDQPLCCRWEHLSAGSQSENIHQMVDRQRVVIGSKMKISAAIAEEIRSRYAQGGMTQRAIGNEYGITNGMVSMIVTGKRWAVAWQA
jgi:predicted XRE-type DNA-binding protein